LKIAIGSDHAGIELKTLITNHLKAWEHDVDDYGVKHGTERAEYPLIAMPLSKDVAAQKYNLGILICGTGIGMSIAANKVKGARAANCLNEIMASYARRHNDANILTLGARIIGSELALSILESFLKSSFDGGRHLERLKMIE
jgi:ribose 5-phosphate isomerase B